MGKFRFKLIGVCMAKTFAPRVSKRSRAQTSSSIDEKIFQMNDDKLLRGAKLSDVRLRDIVVKKQVRTKFNDSSLRELGTNIKENGLIQPLVLHRDGDKFVLICGERRYRAMTLIGMEEAPCFVLEDKTKEELMAIQFSENSAREELHYIDQADSIFNYKKVTGASERKIVAALGISKSEVHRCLLIGKLPRDVKEAAKLYNTEKYVLLEWDVLEKSKFKTSLKKKILTGDIKKRSQLKKAINAGSISVVKAPSQRSSSRLKSGTTASVFLKAMKSKSKTLDPAAQKILEELIRETKEILD
jgi:ParB family transcriptional regulator, chromosome partitioning protein